MKAEKVILSVYSLNCDELCADTKKLFFLVDSLHLLLYYINFMYWSKHDRSPSVLFPYEESYKIK